MCLIQVGQYKYKLNAQYLRLFGLHSDVNDAHRSGANRLQKQTNKQRATLTEKNLLRTCKQYTVRAHVFLMRTVSQRLLSEFLVQFVVITGTHSTHLRGSSTT